MDFSESPDDAAFRARCRAWLEANAAPRWAEGPMGVLGETDPETERAHVAEARAWQSRLAGAGWAALAWPAEYGGQGGTSREQSIFLQEQGRFAVPPNIFLQGIGMAGPTIIAHGTDEQRQRYLRPMLRGEEIWCQLFSEPGAGSDLAALATRAERDGDEFVVNGQKVWTSSAQFSDWGILLARTNPDVPKHRGITYFLVDMRTPGIDVRPLRQITGVAHFNEVFLADVRIPAANVVGPVDGGWGVTLTTLANERASISGGGGGAGGMVHRLLDLQRQAGRAGDPVLRQQTIRAYINARILTFLGWRAQTAAERGRPPGPESSVLKLAHSLHQAEIGDAALAILGADGMLIDYADLDASPWPARFLTQWAVRIGGGTEQVQRNILGERMLGLPREDRPDKAVPFRETART